MADKAPFTIYLDLEKARNLRVAAARSGVSIAAYIESAINDQLQATADAMEVDAGPVVVA